MLSIWINTPVADEIFEISSYAIAAQDETSMLPVVS